MLYVHVPFAGFVDENNSHFINLLRNTVITYYTAGRKIWFMKRS